jgi:hypothetical protein
LLSTSNACNIKSKDKSYIHVEMHNCLHICLYF